VKGDERIRTAEQAPGADPAYGDRAPESMVLLVETVDVLLKTVARLNDTVRILHGRIEREIASRADGS
jgi:hypothetical protein